MGFLFTSKKKEKTVAIFDIASGSVGGAIVSIPYNKNAFPTIIKSFRTEIKKNNTDFDSFMKDMLLALHSTAQSLFHKKAGSPEEIFCTLASPWYLSDIRTIKIEKNNPFIFRRSLADKLILKEISNVTDLYRDKYEDKETLEIIENHIISVSLDNIKTSNPIGKECNVALMNMILSFSPSSFIYDIKEIISKTFHNTNIQFSSFVASSYLAVREKYTSEESYLLVDVSGEITDIGIVIDGVLKSTISFPFGKTSFYNQICEYLEIEKREAKEFISLYNDGNLISIHNDNIIRAIKSVESSWNKSFKESLDLLSLDIIIPNNIFLTVDEDLQKCIVDVLSNFNIKTLNGGDFLDICNVKEGYCDPFLMIEAIAIMRKINK
jgi:hypothetical protein